MKKSGICPKCDSRDVIPGVTIVDHGHDAIYDLGVELYERPESLILKGSHSESKLYAWICGSCGYTELFAENYMDLLRVYKRRKEK